VVALTNIFFAARSKIKMPSFANADFALALALRCYAVDHSLDGAKFFRHILDTYDVACQYYTNLCFQFDNNFPDLADIIDLLYLLIPKMHLDGHQDDCKV
jgi:hypothetical protein